MKDLPSFIPGFRSNKRWKRIVAIIYYVIFVLMMFSEFFTALAGIAFPFLVFGFLDLLKHKKKGIPAKSAIICFAVSFLVFSFAISMADSGSINGNSPIDSGSVNQDEGKSADKDKGQLSTDKQDEKPGNESSDTAAKHPDRTNDANNNDANNKDKDTESDTDNKENEKEGIQNSNVSGKVVVHYIDVGQADSILIQAPSFNMLIDGGNRDNTAVNYIKNHGIYELDLVIGTHPHADHIGGLVNVLKEIKVKEVIDPAVVHTSKTFEDYLTLIDEKNIKFTEAKPGMKRDLGNGAILEILGPVSTSGSNLNNASVVARLAFGNVSFLFTGDSETNVLNQLAKGNIKSDVLKIAHHGSKNGISQEFIKAVNPKAAIISVGKDNSYGHPNKEALDILAANGVDIYRTE